VHERSQFFGHFHSYTEFDYSSLDLCDEKYQHIAVGKVHYYNHDHCFSVHKPSSYFEPVCVLNELSCFWCCRSVCEISVLAICRAARLLHFLLTSTAFLLRRSFLVLLICPSLVRILELIDIFFSRISIACGTQPHRPCSMSKHSCYVIDL
jgi:hypothetical protein